MNSTEASAADAPPAGPMLVPHEIVRAQIERILAAWGMAPEHIATTVDVMVETDLAGIDSHGISMLMMYDGLRRDGRLQLTVAPRIVRQSPVTAVVDAGAGLGHPAAVFGMRLAIDKAKAAGLGAVTVFNSHHFGAAGYYATMAAEAGLIGLVTSTARTVSVVPTRAAVPVLGTNPIAFSAPAARNRPFLLDMATSTVAANKVKVYQFKDKALPPGWVVDAGGAAVVDPHAAMDWIFRHPEGGLSPIGGTAAMGSHKGYGLGVVAQLLSGALAGASFGPLRVKTQSEGDPDNIGHFFLALNPDFFRPEGEFEADSDDVIDVLHATTPADPDAPVLVPGDPEAAARAERTLHGIPVTEALARQIRALCEGCGAPYLLRPA